MLLSKLFGREQRVLKFAVTLTIHELTDVPLNDNIIFVKWKVRGGCVYDSSVSSVRRWFGCGERVCGRVSAPSLVPALTRRRLGGWFGLVHFVLVLCVSVRACVCVGVLRCVVSAVRLGGLGGIRRIRRTGRDIRARASWTTMWSAGTTSFNCMSI